MTTINPFGFGVFDYDSSAFSASLFETVEECLGACSHIAVLCYDPSNLIEKQWPHYMIPEDQIPNIYAFYKVLDDETKKLKTIQKPVPEFYYMELLKEKEILEYIEKYKIYHKKVREFHFPYSSFDSALSETSLKKLGDYSNLDDFFNDKEVIKDFLNQNWYKFLPEKEIVKNQQKINFEESENRFNNFNFKQAFDSYNYKEKQNKVNLFV